jgi:hypothetical protein
MAATNLRRIHSEASREHPPPIVDGIGWFGWLCLVTIGLIASLLVTWF